jgi:hypothetical protein
LARLFANRALNDVSASIKSGQISVPVFSFSLIPSTAVKACIGASFFVSWKPFGIAITIAKILHNNSVIN